MVLPRSFYSRPTLAVLEDLIGKVLVHEVRGRKVSGVIVEAEAYIGEDDPACHAAPGPTRRNEPLYGPPGFAYVYLNYGIHSLVNVVTEPAGYPAAVLIRALDPVDGIAVMRRRRGRGMKGRRTIDASLLAVHDLCRGPGNVTMAMAIGLADNRTDLLGDEIFIDDRRLTIGPIAWGPRIGISVGTEQAWRCYVPGHPCVSGKAALNGGGRRSATRRPADAASTR